MTADNKDLLSPEKLATKEDLGEVEVDALHQEAIKMRENGGETPEKKKPITDKKETAPEDDDTEEGDDDPEETQKTPEILEKEKKDKEVKDAAELEEANNKLVETPDDKLSDKDKQKKAILVRDKAEAALTQEADTIVKSSDGKVTLEEAKKELVSRNKIAEKYKNDPKEMAKALLHSQREFVKVQSENKQLKEAPRPSQLKPGEAIIDGKVIPAEQVREILIEGYREEKPELTEGLDDDKVYDLAVARMKEQNEFAQTSANNKLVLDAKDKRSKVLSTLTDSEKEYAEEITSLVNETPDRVLMNDSWSFDDVKAWARGRYYTPEKLEEVRQEGFKKGREEAEILGAREIETKPSAGGKAPAKRQAGGDLSEADKERARAMYKTEGLTDDDRFAMYADYLAHTKNKKK